MLGVGDADGAGFAVGGATVVEEVELFEEEGSETPFGGLVGGCATNDAGTDDDHVELGIVHGSGSLHFSHSLTVAVMWG